MVDKTDPMLNTTFPPMHILFILELFSTLPPYIKRRDHQVDTLIKSLISHLFATLRLPHFCSNGNYGTLSRFSSFQSAEV